MKIKLKDAFEGKTTKVSFNAGEGRKTISVKIPAGIESGKKIKLKDQGRRAPDGSHGNLMIEIDMAKESLELYDNCIWHKLWKEKYGKLLAQKTIFDRE